MKQEVKVRLDDAEAMEAHLKGMGAVFVQEVHSIDTYFNQPEGELLKTVEDERGNFLVHMQVVDGKFHIKEHQEVSDAKEQQQELEREHGFKKQMRKTRRIYELGGWEIVIDLAEGVGEFMIVVGEDLSREAVAERLQLEDPEFIATPLADL